MGAGMSDFLKLRSLSPITMEDKKLRLHLPLKPRRWISISVVALLLIGCVWKGGHKERHATIDDASAQVWSGRPWRARVYPATRFAEDQSKSILEARIELVDDMGDPVKSAGRLRLELFARSAAGKPDIGQRLYSWDVSILTREDQQRHYDPITRTYVFRLKLDESHTPRIQSVLKVMFISPQGKRIEAQATLPINLYTVESLRPVR